MEKIDSVVIKEIEKELENLNSPATISILVNEQCSDYERGKVAGGIIALQRVLQSIAKKDKNDSDSIIQKEQKRRTRNSPR